MFNSLIDSFLDLDEDNKMKLLKYAKVIINPIKIYILLLLLFIIIITYLNFNINKNLIIILDKL